MDGTPLFEYGAGIFLELSINIEDLDIRLEDILISGENGTILDFDNLNNCN